MFSFRLLTVPLIAFTSLFITSLIIVFPSESLQSAVRGVAIWWEVLFPALFPFFVISEMMLGFGIVHFLGTLLDPMMRPLFRVPGIGGFVMAMGFASGYPVAARLTSQLWEQKLINRDEGERLVAFTSTSDPIFLIGAVSVGFFHDASLAAIIVISHYGAGVIVGLIMRFHGEKTLVSPLQNKASGVIWKRAFDAMHQARINDGRRLGTLLQEAIQSSLKLIFVIGGLVVFFSVILEVFTSAHIMNLFYALIDSLLHFFHIPAELSIAIVNGIFEVTLGAKSAGEAGASIALVHKVAIAVFILSWSGLSVHAQIVSLLTETTMRYRPFFIARLLHGILAVLIVFIAWTPMETLRHKLAVDLPVAVSSYGSLSMYPWMISLSGLVFISTIAVIILLYASMFIVQLLLYRGNNPR